ncbi:MAG: hypothetical protein C5B58_01470 [Acidobacteria bacterium]|nr:MAG: hypothetical protein C5B58_01470 [Acidobacteriota bacterium]
MLPLRLPHKHVQAVPLLVVQSSNRFDVLHFYVRDKAGQVALGVLPLLTPPEPSQERLSELSQPLRGFLPKLQDQLRITPAIAFRISKTSFHRQVLQETPFPRQRLVQITYVRGKTAISRRIQCAAKPAESTYLNFLLGYSLLADARQTPRGVGHPDGDARSCVRRNATSGGSLQIRIGTAARWRSVRKGVCSRVNIAEVRYRVFKSTSARRQ